MLMRDSWSLWAGWPGEPFAHTAPVPGNLLSRRTPLTARCVCWGCGESAGPPSSLWPAPAMTLSSSLKVSWLRSPRKCSEDSGGPREVTPHFLPRPILAVRAASGKWLSSARVCLSCSQHTSQRIPSAGRSPAHLKVSGCQDSRTILPNARLVALLNPFTSLSLFSRL